MKYLEYISSCRIKAQHQPRVKLRSTYHIVISRNMGKMTSRCLIQIPLSLLSWGSGVLQFSPRETHLFRLPRERPASPGTNRSTFLNLSSSGVISDISRETSYSAARTVQAFNKEAIHAPHKQVMLM